MPMPKRYEPFYISHPNPHSISFTTFIHRVKILKRSYERSMDTPYFGRGGDRKTSAFHMKIKLLKYVDPEEGIVA